MEWRFIKNGGVLAVRQWRRRGVFRSRNGELRTMHEGVLMQLLSIDRIIAERTLIAEIGSEQRTVRVVLGEPQAFPEGSGYFCPLQIIGIGSERIHYAGGADSIHSIQLALRMISAYLTSFDASITWPLDESGQTGFEP